MAGFLPAFLLEPEEPELMEDVIWSARSAWTPRAGDKLWGEETQDHAWWRENAVSPAIDDDNTGCKHVDDGRAALKRLADAHSSTSDCVVAVLGVCDLSADSVAEQCAAFGAVRSVDGEFHCSRGAIFVRFADSRHAYVAQGRLAAELRTRGAVECVALLCCAAPAELELDSSDAVTSTVVISGMPLYTAEGDVRAVFRTNAYGEIASVRKERASECAASCAAGVFSTTTARFSVSFYSQADAERAVADLASAPHTLNQLLGSFEAPSVAELARRDALASLLSEWRHEDACLDYYPVTPETSARTSPRFELDTPLSRSSASASASPCRFGSRLSRDSIIASHHSMPHLSPLAQTFQPSRTASSISSEPQYHRDYSYCDSYRDDDEDALLLPSFVCERLGPRCCPVDDDTPLAPHAAYTRRFGGFGTYLPHHPFRATFPLAPAPGFSEQQRAPIQRQTSEETSPGRALRRATARGSSFGKPQNPALSPATPPPDVYFFDQTGLDPRTTLMIRNIPNKYQPDAVLEEIGLAGFTKCYDFFYLPIDFKNKCNVGYAFINLTHHTDAVRFFQQFQGRAWNCFKSIKLCAITYARIQGREAMIERFQCSNLLKESLEVQPRLFVAHGPDKGTPEPFPTPWPPHAPVLRAGGSRAADPLAANAPHRGRGRCAHRGGGGGGKTR